jgi:hypothetical protein
MCNNLAYDSEPAMRRYHMINFYALPTLVLNDFFSMINAIFIVLQFVPPPLCGYKVWIDTKGGPKVISYLCSMAWLNIMEEVFCAHRMMERRRAAYFAIRREMDHE